MSSVSDHQNKVSIEYSELKSFCQWRVLLHFVKIITSMKHNKGKHNKTRHACL